MKKIIKVAARITPVFLALAMFCSSPTDKDVKWRTSVDFPITANTKFYLGAMMDTLFFNGKQVLTKTIGYDTTFDTTKHPTDTILHPILDTTTEILKAYPLYDTSAKPARAIPDTVAFGFPYEKDTSYAITKDTIKDKTFSDAFGPIPLSGTPAETLTVPLTGAYPAAAVPIPAIPPVTVKDVFEVDLMDTPQTMNVTVMNNSAATFSSVQITLGSLGTQTISNLAPNSSGIAQFNARNKVINGTTNVSVTITPAAAGTFAAGNNLQVMFSLDGLTAKKVDVIDSLLANYERTFTNLYDLTDTVNVDYIDIKEGFFTYSVSNYTDIELLLTVVHRNLWISSFCQLHKPRLDSVAALTGLTSQDSIDASNCDVARLSSFKAHTTNTYQKLNLSASRLFPEWNPGDSQSVTKIDYHVNVGSWGRRVTLSAGDSLKFIIKSTKFKFSEMKGTCMMPYQRTSNLSTIPVNLPWSKSVTDSLRNKFILQKVLAKVRTSIGMPRGARLDTVHVTYEIASVNNPALKCDSSTVLVNVDTDAVYLRSIDITKLVNDYPDSVNVKVSLSVDSGTVIKLENDLTTADTAYNKFLGRMNLHGHFNYNLVAPLWWKVADTTVMDLGGTKVDLGGTSGVLDPFARMTDRSASLNVQVTNFTNVYLHLYALAVTYSGLDKAKTKADSLKFIADSLRLDALVADSLDTLGHRYKNPGYIKTNDFNYLINHPTAGYINLLGSVGVLIPPRDSTHRQPNTIALSDQDLSQILNAKTMGIRWEVRFIPQPAGGIVPDALSNTDWMKLNSWIHIDGVNSLDSLFKKK